MTSQEEEVAADTSSMTVHVTNELGKQHATPALIQRFLIRPQPLLREQ
jgi:hypothetical protein